MTHTLNIPTATRHHAALAILTATSPDNIDIPALTRGIIDVTNTWTVELPRMAANLRAASDTEYDFDTHRALLDTADYIDTVDAARWDHRMAAL